MANVRARADQAARDPVRPATGGGEGGASANAPLGILMVDDREENLIALEAVLEPLGQRLVRARSGEEALRRLLAEEFAVILLDVHMPGIDGLETARLIKARGRSRPTPILFVTASSTMRNAWPGYATGAVDFIVKPFDPDVLRAKVAVFVELARSREDARRSAEDRIERARAEAARAAAEAHAAEAERLALELEMQTGALAERTQEAEQLAEDLALSNSRLARAAEAAETGRLRLSLVLDSLPDPANVFDQEWRYRYINPAAAERIRAAGRDPSALIGRVAWDAFPAMRGTRVHAEALRAVRERRVVEIEEYYPAGDLFVEFRVVPAHDGGAVVYLRDVTERRRADAALRESEARAQAARAEAEASADRAVRLQTVAAALSEAATPEAVARVIVVHGVTATGADAGSLALLRGGTGGTPLELEMVQTAGVPEELATSLQRFPVVAGRPLSDAVLTAIPVFVGSRAEWSARYPETLPVMARTGHEAYAAVPVAAGGRVMAGLSFSFREPRAFDDGVRAFLATLGSLCAQALARAELYEAERRARAEAERARLQAEVASRAKSEFLTTMSHELRTPLNSVLGHGELMEMGLHGPVTDAQRDALSRVRRSARHLLSVINDILNMARLEAGALEYRIAPVALDPLLRDVEALLAPQLEAKQLAYRYAGCDLSLRALADEDRLRQVILNLLSNAVKFTDAGGTITLTCEPREADVSVRVADTGRGIPPEKLGSIFEPFVQAHRTLSEPTEGSGLGLAISRQLARGMGGDVTVESEVGVGTEFTLRLPRAEG